MIIYENNKWQLKDSTPEEINALMDVGKFAIINGLAGAFTNDKYKNWLLFTEKEKFFNS